MQPSRYRAFIASETTDMSSIDLENPSRVCEKALAKFRVAINVIKFEALDTQLILHGLRERKDFKFLLSGMKSVSDVQDLATQVCGD